MKWYESWHNKGKVDWSLLGLWVAITLGSLLLYAAATYGMYSYLNRTEPGISTQHQDGQKGCLACHKEGRLSMEDTFGIPVSQCTTSCLLLRVAKLNEKVVRYEDVISDMMQGQWKPGMGLRKEFVEDWYGTPIWSFEAYEKDGGE